MKLQNLSALYAQPPSSVPYPQPSNQLKTMPIVNQPGLTHPQSTVIAGLPQPMPFTNQPQPGPNPGE